MRQTNVRGSLSLRGFRKLRTGAIVATGVILLGLGFLAPTVSASEQDGVWVARTVEEVKADLQKEGDLFKYVIKWGDTLSVISEASNIPVDVLQEMNQTSGKNLFLPHNELYFTEAEMVSDTVTKHKIVIKESGASGEVRTYEVLLKKDQETKAVTFELTDVTEKVEKMTVNYSPVYQPVSAPVVERAEELGKEPASETSAVTSPEVKEETGAPVAPKAEDTATIPAPKETAPEVVTPADPKVEAPTETAEPKGTESEAATPATPKAEDPAESTEAKVTEPESAKPAEPKEADSTSEKETEEVGTEVKPAPKETGEEGKAEDSVSSTASEGESTATQPAVEAGTESAKPATPKEEAPAESKPETPEAGTEVNPTAKEDAPEGTVSEGTTEKEKSEQASNEAGTTAEAEAKVTEPAVTKPAEPKAEAPAPKVEAPTESSEPKGTEPEAAKPATPKAEAPAEPAEPKGTESEVAKPATPKVEAPTEPSEPKGTEPEAAKPATPEEEGTTAEAGTEANPTPKENATEGAGSEGETGTVDSAPAPKESGDEGKEEKETEEAATPAPKEEKPATPAPKTEEEKLLEETKQDSIRENIDAVVNIKLAEIEKIENSDEKEKLKAKLDELRKNAVDAIKNAKDEEEALELTEKHQNIINSLKISGEKYTKPNYDKDNLTNGRNEGTTINDGSTAIGHGSGEAPATTPAQPATTERSTSPTTPTQPSSTSEGASSFRNAPSVQARARRVARSTSEPDGTVNISYNFAEMPDIHGFLSDPGEDNTVTIPAGTSEAQAKELVKEKIQAKIKDLAARGYHVKNDIIFEQDTTVKNYNYVVTFTKETTGTSGFRMALAVQPRASRNRRSLEQPAPQKVKLNVFYNFDQMKDIAGFLGAINETSLEVAAGSTNEQVKAAVKSQVDAKKDELSKRGYTFKEDYVYQANGKDYNYVVTFSKAAK